MRVCSTAPVCGRAVGAFLTPVVRHTRETDMSESFPSVEIRIRIGDYEMVRATAMQAHFVAKFGRADEDGWLDILHSDVVRVIAPLESVHVEIRPIYEELSEEK